LFNRRSPVSFESQPGRHHFPLPSGHHQDGLTLRYWRGGWAEWGGAYREAQDKDIRARLSAFVKEEFDRQNTEEVARFKAVEDDEDLLGFGKKGPPKARKVTTSLVNNVLQALSGYAHLDHRTSQPSWLDGRGPFPAEDVLPTRNALVYLPGLVGSADGATCPPTPRFFCPYSLGYDFDLGAPKPVKWLAFLGQLWPDDPESIATLQEWFGYQLTADTSHQKIFVLIGPKRCGKGTIARILTALVGSENVVNPTLSSLEENFGLAPLIDKVAAVITDARLSGRPDIARVVERLLSISGEDSQTIDRKFLPAWNGKLSARFMLISNELPRLSDTSGALAGRMVVLKLTESFYGREDPGLTDTLLQELPGILLWAIKGWRRLRERGRFIQPASAAPLVEEMEDLASPVGAFLKECCLLEPGSEVSVDDLFSAWRRWCEKQGRDHPGDQAKFGRDLRAVIPGLDVKQRRLPDGRRIRVYHYIRLLVTPGEWP
jgi:putative DNA primase/helicase